MAWYDVVGWLGAGLIVLAYFLISHRQLMGSSLKYQLMNLFGGIGVGVHAYYQASWPSFGLQIIWGAIAVLSLLRIKRPAA